MSERNPALTYIMAMEDNIRTIERIGRLLLYLGERDADIEADSLTALARPLLDHSHDLKVHFADALDAARGAQS